MIIKILLLIISFMITVFVAQLLVSVSYQQFKNNIKINKMLTLFTISFSFSLLYDSLRLFSIYLFNVNVEFVDNMCFVLKIVTLFFCIYAIADIVFEYNKQSGNLVKHETLIKNIYIIFIFILASLGTIFSYKVEIVEAEIFVYQLFPLETFLIGALYAPIFVILVYYSVKLLQAIKNKKRRIQVFVLGNCVVALLFERGLSMYFVTMINIFPIVDYLNILIIDYAAVAVVLCTLVFLYASDKEFLARMSSYFCIKQLYIVKNSGQTIHAFDFEHKVLIDITGVLLGELINAIISGLEKALCVDCNEQNGDIDMITIRRVNLMVNSGNNIFVALVVSEDNNFIKKHLKNFVETLEQKYEEELENWTGNVSLFQTAEFCEWTYNYFNAASKKKKK